VTAEFFSAIILSMAKTTDAPPPPTPAFADPPTRPSAIATPVAPSVLPTAPARAAAPVPSRPVPGVEAESEPEHESLRAPTHEAFEEDPLDHESFQAILSSHQRAGRWVAAEDIEVRAICGEVTLDFTRADLPPSGEVEIHALAICGEVKIIVPDGADVELEGTPFVGSIEQTFRKKGAREWIREKVMGDEDLPPPSRTLEPPLFRIDARAVFGAVKVEGR
jgi:hypothetical protein